MRFRKAQIQTLETIAVLFIFFILLAFAMIFFASIQKSKSYSRVSELQKIESMKIAQGAINLPEISASRRGIAGVNTIDITKMTAFSKVVAENFDLRKGIYEEKLGPSKITVMEIYPSDNEWILYDNPPLKYKSSFNYFVPVSLYNPLDIPSGNYSVGLMRIEYFN